MRWLFTGRKKPTRAMMWDPETVLLQWTAGCPWTIRDSYQSVQVFGSTGSGKTSGSISLLCRSMLSAGYGGLFLTAKREDRSTYEAYIRDAGRTDDLMVFSPDAGLRYNFIAAEMAAAPSAVGQAENLTALLMTVAEVCDRARGSSGGSENAEYFRQAMLRLTRHAMLVLVLSGRDVSVTNLHRLVISAPRSREEARSASWQAQSELYQSLQSSLQRSMSESQRADLELAITFFMEEWAELHSRTRSTVESTLTSATDALSRGAVRDMMSSPSSNFSPTDLYEGGLVIADFPVLVYRDIGQLIQVVLKVCTQRALSRRDVGRSPRPIFIVTDECHLLAVETDAAFQTTARSMNVSVVNATQSISTYLDALGPQSEAQLHSLLGNLQTQIFHQQTDTRTIQYIQELLGRSRQLLMNSNSTRNSDWLGTLLGEPTGSSAGFSEAYEFELQARDLNGLAKGGPPHWFSEAIVYQGGRRFRNGRTWCPVRIPQKR